MTTETHSQLANFIWSICNLLRGPYKRNEYRKVILPLTVLRRFDGFSKNVRDIMERFAFDQQITRMAEKNLLYAWIDESKTKVGCEIPLNRHFYRYEPPRPLEAIQADIRKLEGEIMEMLAEVAR